MSKRKSPRSATQTLTAPRSSAIDSAAPNAASVAGGVSSAPYDEAVARRAVTEALALERKVAREAAQELPTADAVTDTKALVREAELSFHQGAKLLDQVSSADAASALLTAIEQTTGSLRERGLPEDSVALRNLQGLAVEARRAVRRLRAR